MNITYVYYTDHNRHSAHNNQIIHTCNAIADTGHEITVVTAGGLRAYADEHGLGISFDVHNTRWVGLHPTLEQIRYYFEALRTACGSDVIFTRDISFLRFLTFVPKTLIRPVVFEAHKSYTVVDGMDQQEELRRLDRADGVITISDGIRSDLERLGITVDAVVWDAANTEYVPSETREELRSELDFDQNSVVFVYAGSLDPKKYDLRSIIDAFSSFKSPDPTRLYILGGTQSNINRLSEYAAAVGVGDSVQFLGHVPQTLVFRYLKASNIGIVAQQPTDIRASKYTSPLKLFEYLVCGLAVVATDVPSIREIADDEPHIVTYDPDDTEAIQTALRTAVVKSKSEPSDPSRYSYDHRAQKLLSILDKYALT